MNIEIVHKPLQITLFGFSGIAINQNYGDTGFRLMTKMWETVKSRGLKNKGLNVWVYDDKDRMFAGVELEELPEPETGLECKEVTLDRYAYFKHVGPYTMLKERYREMRAELTSRGVNCKSPSVEIYGHWNANESKLETELLMAVE